MKKYIFLILSLITLVVLMLQLTFPVSAAESTCAEQGYTTHTGVCGENYVDSHVDATGHIYQNGICSVCGGEHPNLENYEGKVISVLGDSISTFKGYIPVADGFNEEHPYTYPGRDVKSWNQTWWGLVIDRLNAKLGINDSWSGSRVQNTYTAENPGGNVGTKVCMPSLTRISNLGTNGAPDVILVYGGTNDGKFSTFGGFDSSLDYSQVDLNAVTWKTFEEAYVAMIMRLQYYYPEAKIIVLLPTHVASWYTDEKLTVMNNSIIQICEYFDIDYVDVRECGITLEDLPDGLHPNAKGMTYIADAVLEALLNINEVNTGENIVHSVTHNLDGAKASNGHYKGVSSNTRFEEILTGDFECVSVTMNGIDITKSCYENGTICIDSVNGDIVICAKQHNYSSVVTLPTCTEEGYTTHTCACGDSYVDSYTDAIGHSYKNGSCSVCKADEPMPSANSIDELTDLIREEMIKRESNIEIRVNGLALTGSDTLASIIAALEHTGDPRGGDYIRAHIVGGYTYNAEVRSDSDGIYTIVTVNVDFISDAQMEAEVDAAVKALLDELDLWDATDYQKIKGVYDWITDNIVYDYEWDDEYNDDAHYYHTAHAAIVDKKVVCQGIASLFYRLMLELDVDCRYITGMSNYPGNSEYHAWNIVALDGKYYNMDATWDLGLTGYYRYFLRTEANFAWHDRDYQYATASFNAQYPMATLPYVENATASGTVNSRISWVLDGDTGTLTVAGTGAISSYRFSKAPWYDYRNSVKRIVVEEGITEVGERAFYWSINCTELCLPESLIAIREYGFNNLQNLKQVTLPSNLRIIELCAFSECTALESITLPDSVTTVGSSAFSNCYALRSATLSAGMNYIPDSMFFGDYRLSSITIPEGVVRIDDTVFSDCGFTQFTIPSTVTKIGVSAFSSCDSLSKFIVEEGNTAYKAVDGVLFSADGTHLISYPAGKTGYSYSVPEGTKYIDYGAFREQRYLYYVYFPSSLIKIDGYAFSYCKRLQKVTLPSTLTTLGSDIFRDCTSLYSVTFENQSIVLGDYLFSGCTSLSSITLPTKLAAIPNGLFDDCTGLRSINIPSTVTKIGSTAFCNCDSLTSITIPGSVKSIGQQAFDFCQNLTTIIFEDGVKTLDWIVVRNAPRLTKVVIPSSVTSIGKENFENCPNVTLYVTCYSAGYNYAKNNGIKYSTSHYYSYLTVTYPTCTEQGYTTYTCACGDSYKSNYVSRLGHTEAIYEAVAPDCINDGLTEGKYCSVCGVVIVEQRVVSALGHSLIQHEGKSPTCLESGFDPYVSCSGCNYTTYNDIPATGHNYESVVTAPTCTEEGYITHTCLGCGDSYMDNYVNKLGHTEAIYEAVAPDCINDGLTEGKYCSVCGVVLVEQRVIAALGHSLIQHEGKSPTCLESGFSAYVVCSVCSYTTYKDIPATGHNYESKVTSPTCTEQGYTTYTCSGCGDSYVTDYTVLNGHDWKNEIIIVNPTCTTDGIITYICSCGEEKTEVKPATGHNYESKVTSPTCTEQGYTTYTCSGCGDSYVDNYTEKIDHNWSNEIIIVNPTCTTDGVITYICFCGEEKTEVKPATGHNYESKVTSPTCTEQGFTTYICSECGDYYVADFVDAIGHIAGIAVVENNIAPDCISKGSYENVFYCIVCGEEIDRTIVFADALGHAFTSYISNGDATCTKDGTETARCDRCDVTDTRINVGSALGHNYSGAVTDPDCVNEGYTTYTCSVCADHYVSDFAAALGHTEAVDTAVVPTCTETGLTEGKHCSVCGEILVAQDIVPSIGHDYDSVVTDPTCEEQGYTTHICHCGYYYVADLVDALGHTEAVDTAVVPTCTETGLTEGKHCSVCGEILVAQEVVLATGHDYDSVVTDPTCEEQGYTTHICHCGDVIVDTYVESLGHSLGEWQTEKEPTCEGKGSEARYCKRCDYSEARSISPCGHSWVDEEEYEVCTSCGEIIEKDPSELEKDHSECEAGVFETIISLIINLFRMLFGLPQICVCGEEY